MNLKGVLAVVLVLLIVLAGYTMLTMQSKKAEVKTAPEPFGFNLFIPEQGILDNDQGRSYRAFFTADITSSGVKNASITMVLLPEVPKAEVYEVTDYPSGKEKKDVMENAKALLSGYGISVSGISLKDALEKEDAIIIIPSDAIPDRLVSNEINELIDGNVVVFFGKSFEISIDKTASQTLLGNRLYDQLNVTYDKRGFAAKFGGPDVFLDANATILEYNGGWFVVYNDLKNDGANMAKMILEQRWQSGASKNHFSPVILGNQTLGFYSSPLTRANVSMRILYNVSSLNESSAGVVDLKNPKKPVGRLKVDETYSSQDGFDYSFELKDNLDYPAMYDFKLQFFKEGKLIDSVPAKAVIMKTVAIESGTVHPNLSYGTYVVKLSDQNGAVHASAYTNIPYVKVQLVRIAGSEHIFKITENGKPAANVLVGLLVNNKTRFSLKTDQNGEAKTSLKLPSGLNSFTVELNGQRGTTYYEKKGGGFGLMQIAFLFGIALLAAGFFLGSRGRKRYFIKTYQRPSAISRTLKIPHSVFLRIFGMSQESRAKGLPLSVSDLRIGFRKYAMFKGTPVFLTDSNIFRILDGMVKKGSFLSFAGYYLPREMVGRKPIEYWVIRRRLFDHFIERGEDISKVRNADFKFRGRLVHIWHDLLDPKILVSLCKKSDNLIIFPDEKRKLDFCLKAAKYDPDWMRVSLELQYGRIYCQTIDNFLGRGSNGKN